MLSFPIDEDGRAGAAPRELGDVVICREYTEDLPEAVDPRRPASRRAWTTSATRARCSRSSTSCARGCEGAGSSRWPGGRTSASRRSSTRWWARRSRSSPTSRRPRGGRSAASPPRAALAARAGGPAGRAAPARHAHPAHAAPRRARARGVRRRAARARRRAGRRSGGPLPRPTCSSQPTCPVVVAVNKIDRLNRARDRRRAQRRGRRARVGDDVFPVSAEAWHRNGRCSPSTWRR